ncbi:hypothetical protein FJ251_11415 [bacterium]|nr:hypothetical protein [bacterium]
MKKLLLLLALVALAVPAAALTYTYGWEDGTSTLLSVFPLSPPGMLAYNVTGPDPVYGGTYSLKTVDNSTGTPQGYVVWIRGLMNGDVVTASVARYDTTPNAQPSGRIWGHYNDNPLDVNGYNGSASGNSDYGLGLGWDITSYTWTMTGGHTGLVVELRTYTDPGSTVWWDNLEVVVPDRTGIFVEFPGGYIPVEDNTISSIKALY